MANAYNFFKTWIKMKNWNIDADLMPVPPGPCLTQLKTIRQPVGMQSFLIIYP